MPWLDFCRTFQRSSRYIKNAVQRTTKLEFQLCTWLRKKKSSLVQRSALVPVHPKVMVPSKETKVTLTKIAVLVTNTQRKATWCTSQSGLTNEIPRMILTNACHEITGNSDLASHKTRWDTQRAGEAVSEFVNITACQSEIYE